MPSGPPRPPRSRPIRRAGPAVAAVALALALLGCTEDQDPGLDPGSEGPATTSDTLGTCPPGGPDATTPPAGCIGPEGNVLRG